MSETDYDAMRSSALSDGLRREIEANLRFGRIMTSEMLATAALLRSISEAQYAAHLAKLIGTQPT